MVDQENNGPSDEVIYKQINHHLMTKAMLRYTILKVRAKISYHAFLNKETIQQQFLR